MRDWHKAALSAVFLAILFAPWPGARGETMNGAHAYHFSAIDGGELPLGQFAGKVMLIVNTASFCGYTPQYRALQALYDRFRDRGLVVIGVPSNDFGGQEPGDAGTIKTFCETTYGIDFPLAGKSRVRGGEAHPFYRWAAAELGGEAAPRWNFHKYLVAPDGSLVRAFATAVEPDDPSLVRAIEALLPG
ncbi:glutathione peroxidase [Oceanibacterium hippocampi]|uniref:Glutathione peroxidase n=1 Tax=Oceanibacterium hippocampi TaxID=745714 RepID=A0A1Y5S2G5_9PROT|nr:glutathione peroxidase [Oceanibacterium hippocampi]SLN28126.1 Hydroperoxy fatty acid reductase gpx1 [Oceanibacterium hippocampi]